MRKQCLMPMAVSGAVVQSQPIRIVVDQPVEWVHITPELAMRWLESNKNNRTVREAYVTRLAHDMTTGKWKGRNGEAIRFDAKGRLIDGQHRLWACVQSQVGFDSLVISGLDENDYNTIGVGASKSFADFLGPVHGEKNVHLYAASVRLVFHWRNGTLDVMQDGTKMPTIQDLDATYAANPLLRDSVNFSSMKVRLMVGSIAALIHYTARLADMAGTAETFIEQVEDGLGLTEDNPAYRLRTLLLGFSRKAGSFNKPTKQFVMALTLKAWVYAKNGKKIKDLRFRQGEEFPVI